MATTIYYLEEGKKHCEFCTERPTRMFKAQSRPIVIEFEDRKYVATKPYWIACTSCAESIENDCLAEIRNKMEAQLQSVVSEFASIAPNGSLPSQQVEDWLVRMSFVAMGLPTIRKVLEIPSRPIDWGMVRTQNAKIRADLDEYLG